MVFDVAVLDGRCIVPALHLDEPRLPAGGLIVAAADGGVGQNVAGVVLLDLRRAGLHGLLHVQHKGVLVIVHLHQPCGPGGGNLVLGDHHSNLVAVVAHVPVQQQPVGHVLMMGVRGPGMARRGKGDVRHIEAGKDPHHAGDLLSPRRVHRAHHTVSDGGMDNPGDQRGPAAQVLGVLRAARRLVKGVHADLALTYAFAHRASASCLSIDGKFGKRDKFFAVC